MVLATLRGAPLTLVPTLLIALIAAALIGDIRWRTQIVTDDVVWALLFSQSPLRNNFGRITGEDSRCRKPCGLALEAG